MAPKRSNVAGAGGSKPKKDAAKREDEDNREMLPEPKKAKTEDQRTLHLVAEAAVALDHIKYSEMSCKMLRDMMPGCLAAPANEPWHRFQGAMLDIFQQVMAEAEAEVGGADVNFQGVEKMDPESRLRSREEALEAAKASFCEDNINMQMAWQAFGEATAANTAYQAKVHEESALITSIEVALRVHYPPVLEGTGKDTARHMAVLLPLVKKLPVDESLFRAFPVATAKRAEDRGTFDRAAVRQMQTELGKYRAALVEKAAKATPEVAAKERADAEATAWKTLEAARARQQASAGSLREAELDWYEALDAVDFKDEARTTKQRDLEDFLGGPKAAFDALVRRRMEMPAVAVAIH